MRRIRGFFGLLLCSALMACTSSTIDSTEYNVRARSVITLENAGRITQLDFRIDKVGDMGRGVRVEFSPNGEILAIGAGAPSGGSIYLYNLRTADKLGELVTHLANFNSFRFSPDGKLIAACGGRVVKIWDVTTQEMILQLDKLSERCTDIVFSPDSTTLASAEPGTWFPHPIEIWSVSTGELVSAIEQSTRKARLAFNPDGTLLAAISDNCSNVDIWEVSSLVEYRALGATHCTEGSDLVVAFSPNGKVLAASSGGIYTTSTFIRLWDVEGGDRLHELKGDENTLANSVTSVAFSPNNQIVATAGKTNVYLWEVETGNKLLNLAGGVSVAFSPDGSILASGGDIVRLWSVPED